MELLVWPCGRFDYELVVVDVDVVGCLNIEHLLRIRLLLQALGLLIHQHLRVDLCLHVLIQRVLRLNLLVVVENERSLRVGPTRVVVLGRVAHQVRLQLSLRSHVLGVVSIALDEQVRMLLHVVLLAVLRVLRKLLPRLNLSVGS